jgi:hypothetical protein
VTKNLMCHVANAYFFAAQMALLTGIGLALPAAVAAIRIFGPEKQIYFREASAGGSTVAYFIGKGQIQLF